MNACKSYHDKVMLYFYNELPGTERLDVENHLASCDSCKAAMFQLESLQKALPEQSYDEPDEAAMQLLRNTISRRIRTEKSIGNELLNMFSTMLQPAPALRIGFALTLFVAGYFIGRQNDGAVLPGQNTQFEQLLTANEQVQSENSEINPLLASIDKLSYDAKTGNIEISYVTVNDIQLQGNMENPTVRQMLRQAILEKDNPAVRLHAVKAVKSFTESNQTQLDPGIVEALTTLIKNEDNLGVRLKVLRVLKTLLPNPYAKATLVRVLLDDPDSAMRIEALTALLEQELEADDIGILHKIARDDSNGYIRSQAKLTIDKYGVSDEQ